MNTITGKLPVYGKCNAVSIYRQLNQIGEGTYGKVYRAQHKETGEIVALKKIMMLKDNTSGFPLTSVREISVLKKLSHPNIIALHDIVVGKYPSSVFLVFEYCEHDLSRLIDSISRPFSEAAVKGLMLELLSAVEYMHKSFIVHRDIKMSNLLYNSRGNLKLADFGLARRVGEPKSSHTRALTPTVVTLWYRAPELLLGEVKYSKAIDLWSVGCIFAELLSGEPLFPGQNELNQLSLIYNRLGKPSHESLQHLSIFPDLKFHHSIKVKSSSTGNDLKTLFPRISQHGINLLHGLLSYDPDSRLSATQALDHIYFQTTPLPLTPPVMPTFPSLHKDLKYHEKHRVRHLNRNQLNNRKKDKTGNIVISPSRNNGF